MACSTVSWQLLTTARFLMRIHTVDGDYILVCKVRMVCIYDDILLIYKRSVGVRNVIKCCSHVVWSETISIKLWPSSLCVWLYHINNYEQYSSYDTGDVAQSKYTCMCNTQYYYSTRYIISPIQKSAWQTVSHKLLGDTMCIKVTARA